MRLSGASEAIPKQGAAWKGDGESQGWGSMHPLRSVRCPVSPETGEGDTRVERGKCQPAGLIGMGAGQGEKI